MATDANIIIGGFYELPDGSIARTFAWDGSNRRVAYHLDDGTGTRSATEAEAAGTWKRRADLGDFPDARDPVLPHVFDLFWDARTRSKLPLLLADPEVAPDVREAMEAHGIVLTGAEREALDLLIEDAAAPSF